MVEWSRTAEHVHTFLKLRRINHELDFDSHAIRIPYKVEAARKRLHQISKPGELASLSFGTAVQNRVNELLAARSGHEAKVTDYPRLNEMTIYFEKKHKKE